MLKSIMSSQMLIANKVLAINEVDGVKDSNELIEKSEKLIKIGKLLKGLKLSKSRNSNGKKLAKSKKPSKSGNLFNFNGKEADLSFLIPKARIAFNRLQLAFTKAPILWYFDLQCHIWIKTNTLGYAISDVLS